LKPILTKNYKFHKNIFLKIFNLKQNIPKAPPNYLNKIFWGGRFKKQKLNQKREAK
jgi:hypothetical protein